MKLETKNMKELDITAALDAAKRIPGHIAEGLSRWLDKDQGLLANGRLAPEQCDAVMRERRKLEVVYLVAYVMDAVFQDVLPRSYAWLCYWW